MHSSENPFSTKFVRPGAIAYRFPAGFSAETVFARFVGQGARGAIVGPHGSGKSTLLETLKCEFSRRGWALLAFSLHEGETALPDGWRNRIKRQQHQSRGPLVVIVDGYEQLGWLAAWQLHRVCRRAGIGLLVTAHQTVRYPTIYQTQPDELTFQALVAGLTAASVGQRVSEQAIAEAWREQRGNIREALFALYDAYERQRRC